VKPHEALAALADVLTGTPNLDVATIASGVKDADPPEARVLKLADEAEQEFRSIIDKTVAAKLSPVDWTLKELDPVYKPETGGVEVEWIRLSEIPAVSQAIDRLDNLSGLAGFDPSDSAYLKRLAYWGARVGATDNRAYFFRRFSASAELKRKNKAAMVLKSGTFQLVEERIFLFDQAVDCFVYADYVFVLRKTDFRSVFEQMKAVFEKARSAASDLHGRLPIANFADFQDACGRDSRLADKMISIRERDYFDQLSYSTVRPIIEEFALDIPTTNGKDGQVELEFRSAPAERFRILRLCDDDYLRSGMTQHRYEVNSKTDHS
jgi:hypothetical protein